MGFTDIPLAQSALDRAANRRTEPDLIATLLADEATLVLPIYDREVPIAPPATERAGATPHGADSPQLHMIAPSQVPGYLATHQETMWVYLGELAGKDIVAIVIPTTVGDIETDPWRASLNWAPLRFFAEAAALREEYLETEERAGLAVVAVALANWHSTSRFCGRCGARTVIATAGWTRNCTGCLVEHFPRTDPAVIMAVLSPDDRILLGNSTKWPADRFSTLAGFVEPGETLEAAVRREVFEESGVHTGEVTYLGSQPWPFPGSLMLGYFATATSTEITVDGEEIRQARWFSRTELAAEVASGQLSLPGVSSIARRLIEHWYGEKITTPKQ